MPQRRLRNTTLGVSKAQHGRFKKLVAMTGLQSAVLMDRLLDLAEANIQQLVAVSPRELARPGVRAAG